MNRGAWQAIVSGCKESDLTEQLSTNTTLALLWHTVMPGTTLVQCMGLT